MECVIICDLVFRKTKKNLEYGKYLEKGLSEIFIWLKFKFKIKSYTRKEKKIADPARPKTQRSKLIGPFPAMRQPTQPAKKLKEKK